jgi:hypothetical protein
MYVKNEAVTGFCFGMVDASDGSAIVSGSCTGEIVKDNGTATALTNTPAHKSDGLWSVNLTAGEMNANPIGLVFTHADAVPTYFTIKTETKDMADLNDLSGTGVAVELATYDGPTKAEMDAGFAALNDLSAAQVNAECDTSLSDYDPPTKTEMDAKIDALNDVSSADVTTACTSSLKTYDPPTKAELDLAESNIRGTDSDDLKDLSDQIDGVGGTGLTAQETRDAMKLAPTAGSPAAGSIDKHLDDLVPGSPVNLEISGQTMTIT